MEMEQQTDLTHGATDGRTDGALLIYYRTEGREHSNQVMRQVSLWSYVTC